MADQIDRENFLEAKTIVSRREADFFDSIKSANTFSLIAHSGAIVALLGFLGSSGARIQPLWPFVLALLAFAIGLVLGGRTLTLIARILREDLRISVTSFIEAAHKNNIMLFTDTASGREQELDKLFKNWRWSAIFFAIGCCVCALSLSLVGWLPEEPPKPNLYLL
jgi:hypothetical protein